MYIGFLFFFFFFLRICGFALPVSFFCLNWVYFTFRIDVGIFCGLALLQIYIYIFLDFSSKIFWAFFFCLKVE